MPKRLRKSDIRALADQLPIAPSKNDVVEVDDSYLIVNSTIWYFKRDDAWIPSLKLVLENRNLLPSVVVDMGAVRHVANGADIMRPGIISFDEAKQGAIVTIKDEKNAMPLAIGQMLADASDAKDESEGKCVQSLHYVGDEIWNA